MSVFKDVTITWGGEDYTIPAGDVMRTIAVLENEISLQELTRPAGPPFAKLAFAYAIVLNRVGVKVSADEVYASLFDGEQQAEVIGAATTGLLMIMMPPSTYNPPVGKDQAAS